MVTSAEQVEVLAATLSAAQALPTSSEQVDQLAAALCAAQSEIRDAAKNAEGQARGGKYSYADLGAVWDAVRTPLSKNGLAITQTIVPAKGETFLRTRLLHKSGQWEASHHPLPSYATTTPQVYGSALTYARRYSLQAITGVAPADDDGAVAQAAAEGRKEADPKPAGNASAPRNGSARREREARPAAWETARKLAGFVPGFVKAENHAWAKHQEKEGVDPAKRRELVNDFSVVGGFIKTLIAEGQIQEAAVTAGDKWDQKLVWQFASDYYDEYPEWTREKVRQRTDARWEKECATLGIDNPRARQETEAGARG